MDEVSPKHWRLRPEPISPEWRDFCADGSIPKPAFAVLWNRGIRTCAEAERFLNPRLTDLEDPLSMPDMADAVTRILRALAAGETILTYGDYDVDGLTSVALCSLLLRHLGGRVATALPNRMEDGYGLSVRAIEEARDIGATLVIACDCGTTAYRAVERAAELRLDVIVIDHHTPGPSLPQPLALINPKRPDSHYSFPDLAAVGVTYKAMQALVAETGAAADLAFLEAQLDLVALGTVADSAPLVRENRILVQAGLRVLRESPRPGVLALMETAGVAPENLDTSNLAHFLGPRLNASGRLGEPLRTLDLLMAEDPADAHRLAGAVETDNRERRRLHEKVLAEALAELDRCPANSDKAIVLASEEWHPGVLGIVASRLAERFAKPALLISLQGATARGSARTPAGIDLLEWMGKADRVLSAYGGHPQAAGLSFPPERYSELRLSLLRSARDLPRMTEPSEIEVDGILDPSACEFHLARWLERLAPFGRGNPEPLFVGKTSCRDIRVQHGRHLRIRAGRGSRFVDCIGFGMAGRAAELFGGAEVEIVYHPTVNRHRGDDRVQLKLREISLG